jgi:hypothetical protein
LAVKEKELKKLRLSQLILDTQMTNFDGQQKYLNHTVRHSNTVYRSKKLASFSGKEMLNNLMQNE